MIDKWYNENEIHKLPIKSTAWHKVQRTVTNMIADAIGTYLYISPWDVKYSSTCGCACGCSPGFKVKLLDGDVSAGHDIWVKIENVTDVEKKMVLRAMTKAVPLLEKDWFEATTDKL